jgi:hypothetical protein
MAAMKFNKSVFREKMQEWMQENATGILGTVAFHMILAIIFLVIKISSEKSYLESIILFEIEEELAEEQVEEDIPDPEFDQRLADYLEQARSNVPVNLARNVEEEIRSWMVKRMNPRRKGKPTSDLQISIIHSKTVTISACPFLFINVRDQDW